MAARPDPTPMIMPRRPPTKCRPNTVPNKAPPPSQHTNHMISMKVMVFRNSNDESAELCIQLQDPAVRRFSQAMVCGVCHEAKPACYQSPQADSRSCRLGTGGFGEMRWSGDLVSLAWASARIDSSVRAPTWSARRRAWSARALVLASGRAVGQHRPSCLLVAVAVLSVEVVSLSSDGAFRSASAIALPTHVVTPASARGDFVSGRSDLVSPRNTFVTTRAYNVSERLCLVNARMCSVTARSWACAASATFTT